MNDLDLRLFLFTALRNIPILVIFGYSIYLLYLRKDGCSWCQVIGVSLVILTRFHFMLMPTLWQWLQMLASHSASVLRLWMNVNALFTYFDPEAIGWLLFAAGFATHIHQESIKLREEAQSNELAEQNET